jgi:hypothetical protein
VSLAELRECDAPPDIVAIYDALREASGVPQVNLIWRHAASLPGVLEWLWVQARPALASGAAAGARDRIAARVPLPAMMRVPAPPGVAALVETYNRGNLTNLALLTAIRLRAAGASGAAPGAPAPIGPPLPTPPPLPRLDALSPALAGSVAVLTARPVGCLGDTEPLPASGAVAGAAGGATRGPRAAALRGRTGRGALRAAFVAAPD